MTHVTEIVKLRRKVITELARLAYEETLTDKVTDILTTVVTEDGPRYRCCVHKERAVLKDRINIALSQPLTNDIKESANLAAEGGIASEMPIINVLPEACDQCPLDKFLVTDACRNCIAHHCIASCPKKAISVHQNRAYIDKTRCIECGMCKKSCPYGAIIEISRPCERACELGAIKAGADRRAVIDYDQCVQCGACKNACPFGAIGERTYIVQLIREIKQGKNVIALIAPAIVGQFGFKVSLGQIVNSIIKLGFQEVYEVALGADMVTLEEAHEYIENIAEGQKQFMTTSCCPAFVSMIEKHVENAVDHVSTTVSPMIATARMVRKQQPDSILVFVGPCTAKKVEALKYESGVDYVITYEELAAMFVGAGINVSQTEERAFEKLSSADGSGFACSGGVMQAVQDVLSKLDKESCLKGQRCEGLESCKKTVSDTAAGKLDVNFIEGMACYGGCVGGPGTLTDYRITAKAVEANSKGSAVKAADDNELAQSERKTVSMHK